MALLRRKRVVILPRNGVVILSRNGVVILSRKRVAYLQRKRVHLLSPNHEDVVGREAVEARGGRLVLLPFLPGHSTSLIEARIRSGQGVSIPDALAVAPCQGPR